MNIADIYFNVENEGVFLRTALKANFSISRKTLGFRGGHYEEWGLLGCYAMWLL
jgi:hypothetical protein